MIRSSKSEVIEKGKNGNEKAAKGKRCSYYHSRRSEVLWPRLGRVGRRKKCGTDDDSGGKGATSTRYTTNTLVLVSR